jgi:hypothetical protein
MPVVPVSTLVGGGLAVPADVGTAGWWAGGGRLGDLFGAMVLVGHVDAADQGIGPMAGLLRTRPGMVVAVSGVGVSQRFRVVRVVRVPKVDLTTSADGASPFDQSGDLRLVLITCSGRFDPVTRHYSDNQVVVAEPVA